MPHGSSASSVHVRRPRADELGAYYHGYVALVTRDEVLPALERGLGETLALLERFGEERGGYRYAPGKWSVKEVVGHLIDGERVFSYRALRIGRGDATPLPGFEQDDYVAAGGFDARTLEDLAGELGELRAANLRLFRSFGADAWEHRGTASDAPCIACALPWIIAGHENHHRRVLAERYLPR